MYILFFNWTKSPQTNGQYRAGQPGQGPSGQNCSRRHLPFTSPTLVLLKKQKVTTPVQLPPGGGGASRSTAAGCRLRRRALGSRQHISICFCCSGGLTVTSRQQRIVVATAAQGKLVTLATKFYTKDFISLELSKLP
jgi:hypothetical protein